MCTKLKIISGLMTIMLALQLPFSVNASNTVENVSSEKISTKLKTKMSEMSSSETTPVYIWYEDIDHSEVEQVVENKLQNRIWTMTASSGLTTQQPDNIIANTSEQYITEKRLESKQAYEAKSNEYARSVGLDSDKILFKSKYAPMIIADLTMNEIESLSRKAQTSSLAPYKNMVVALESDSDEALDDFTNEISTQSESNSSGNYGRNYYDCGMDAVHANQAFADLDGTGIKIGVLDSGPYIYKNLPVAPNQGDSDLYIINHCDQTNCPTGTSGKYVEGGHYHAMYKNTPVYIMDTSGGVMDYSNYNTRMFDVGNNIYNANDILDGHASYMMDIIAGTNDDIVGFARNAEIYYACTSGYLIITYQNIEALLDAGVSVINNACPYSYGDDDVAGYYSDYEKWLDHIAVNHNTLFVIAGGNHFDGQVNLRFTGGSLSYNVLTVAASSASTPDCDNKNVENDYKYLYGDGCFKPDVTSPFGDTSSASASVTGMTALIHQLYPTLKTRPELTKAILMASCQRKAYTKEEVNGETVYLPRNMTDGLTDKQGAGIVNIYNALCITDMRQFGYGEFSGRSEYFGITAIGKTSSINVVTTWLKNNSFNNGSSHYGTLDEAISIPDLNMFAYKWNKENSVFDLCCSSAKPRSSAEMTYFALDEGENNIKFMIRKDGEDTGSDTQNVRYAYAWSTSDQKYVDSYDGNGLFYFRDPATNKYMTADLLEDTAIEQDRNGNHNQLWVAQNTSVPYGTLRSALNGKYLAFGAYNTNESAYAVTLSSLPYEMYYCPSSIFANMYNLTPRAHLLTAKPNGELYWLMESSSCVNWHIERLPYFRGDVNMDGVVDLGDVRVLVAYVSSGGSGIYNAEEQYLADYNGDGTINTADIRQVQTAIASNATPKY